MIETAIVLGVAICISFLALLIAKPHVVRKWVIQKRLTLDTVLGTLALALTVPIIPETFSGALLAGAAWTTGVLIARKVSTNPNISSMLSRVGILQSQPLPVR